MVLQYNSNRYSIQLHRLHDLSGDLLCGDPDGYPCDNRYLLCIVQFPTKEVQICVASETSKDLLWPPRDCVLS
jgi:hypothetical protein